MENIDNPSPATVPSPAIGENSSIEPGSAIVSTGPGRPAGTSPSAGRVLDLVALVLLIALSAVVFTVAGPAAFTAVSSVGMGLFATWRSSHPRPPHR